MQVHLCSFSFSLHNIFPGKILLLYIEYSVTTYDKKKYVKNVFSKLSQPNESIYNI